MLDDRRGDNRNMSLDSFGGERALLCATTFVINDMLITIIIFVACIIPVGWIQLILSKLKIRIGYPFCW